MMMIIMIIKIDDMIIIILILVIIRKGRGILNRAENTRRGRGRSRLTWEEAIKRDLKE
jgi:nitrogen fixation/metabolism regulation signal transduction histidine kinase